jgi:hypothetical protein
MAAWSEMMPPSTCSLWTKVFCHRLAMCWWKNVVFAPLLVSMLKLRMQSTLVGGGGEQLGLHGNIQFQHHLRCYHLLQLNTPHIFVSPTHKVARCALRVCGDLMERVQISILLTPSGLNYLPKAI